MSSNRCSINHNYDVLVSFPYEQQSTQRFCLRITAYYIFAFLLWREISNLVRGHTHFCRASRLVNPECTLALQAWGVAMISVQLPRHGLVRRGNGLIVTVNPDDWWCSGSGGPRWLMHMVSTCGPRLVGQRFIGYPFFSLSIKLLASAYRNVEC